VAKLQEYTINLYKEIEEISGQSTGCHVTGGVMLVSTPERLDWLKMAHARNKYLGVDTRMISVDEAAEHFPLMDKSKFVGAMWHPLEGHLDPSGTTHAYAKAARVNGAEVVRHNRVLETNQIEDGKWQVVTEKGTVTCEHLINAGGLWGREVGRMAGIEIPALCMAHQYLLTEEMEEVVAYNEANDGREVVHAIDFDGEIYMRQEGKGMLMGTYEPNGVPWSPKQAPWDFSTELLPPDLDQIADNLARGFEHHPAFQKAGIKNVIHGPFAFGPDGNPLVGPDPRPAELLDRLRCHGRLQPGWRRGPCTVQLDRRRRPRLRRVGDGHCALRLLRQHGVHQCQGARKLWPALPHHVPQRGTDRRASLAHHAAV
jgi:dimethylglycine dehydrogenase